MFYQKAMQLFRFFEINKSKDSGARHADRARLAGAVGGAGEQRAAGRARRASIGGSLKLNKKPVLKSEYEWIHPQESSHICEYLSISGAERAEGVCRTTSARSHAQQLSTVLSHAHRSQTPSLPSACLSSLLSLLPPALLVSSVWVCVFAECACAQLFSLHSSASARHMASTRASTLAASSRATFCCSCCSSLLQLLLTSVPSLPPSDSAPPTPLALPSPPAAPPRPAVIH